MIESRPAALLVPRFSPKRHRRGTATVSLQTAFNIAQILVSVMLIIVLTLQAKGSGFGSALGGQTSSVFRTRRGVERTLFNLTILLCVVWIAISLLSVRAAR